MPFINCWTHPSEWSFNEDSSGISLTALVAVEDDGCRSVLVKSELLYAQDLGMEFTFQIIVLCHDGSYEDFATFSRQQAFSYIPKETRPWVMDVVCYSLSQLVERARPAGIYRVTKEPSPVQKALVKHERITKCLEGLGYSVVGSDFDPAGRLYWMMERSTDKD